MDAIDRLGGAGFAFRVGGRDVGVRVSDEVFASDLRRFAADGAGENA